MKKMMKNLMVLLLLVAAAYGTKPKCNELKDTVVLENDADICEAVPDILNSIILGNPVIPVTMDFSTADETTLNNFLAKFDRVSGAVVMDGNERVTNLNFGSITHFTIYAAPGTVFMIIRNNLKLEKIDWNSAIDILDLNVVILVYNNPLLDATSLETLRTALNGKKKIKHHIQSAGECQFEHPLEPADPAKYIAPSAKLLENCKTIKGDFVVKDASLVGLGNEINLDPSGCLKLINVDMKGVKLAASNYTGTGTCKDGTMSEITGNPNLCGPELEKLHSSYGNNTAVKADPATCTVPCTPGQQSSQGIYFFCLPTTTADPTTTAEPSTNTMNRAAALIGQPTPGPAKDNTEKSSTMELWKILTIVGSVILIILIGVVVFFWCKKKWCCHRFDDPEIVPEHKDEKKTSMEKPGSKEELVPGVEKDKKPEDVQDLPASTQTGTPQANGNMAPVKEEKAHAVKNSGSNVASNTSSQDVTEPQNLTRRADLLANTITQSTKNLAVDSKDNKDANLNPVKETKPKGSKDHKADLPTNTTEADENMEQNLKENKNVTPKTTTEDRPKLIKNPAMPNIAQSKDTVTSKVNGGAKIFTEKMHYEMILANLSEVNFQVFEPDEKDPLAKPETVVRLFKFSKKHVGNCKNFINLNKKTIELLKRQHENEPKCHGWRDKDKYQKMITKNYARYHTRCPHEDNLVKVKDVNAVEDPYVNMNKIDSGKRLIFAAEGPTNELKLIENYYRVAVQDKVQTFVMVASCKENDKDKIIDKCSQYFPTPDNRTMDFGKVKVTCLFVVTRGKSIHQSRLRVEIDGVPGAHYLDHIQFTAWPDQSVPALEDWMHVPYLFDLVDMPGKDKTKPIIVHCSAGIGRTGSFIALYIIMEKLKNGEIVNVHEVFQLVRRARAFAIYKPCQYLFLHALPMLQFLLDGVVTDRKTVIAYLNELIVAIHEELTGKPSNEKPSNENPSHEKQSKEGSKKTKSKKKRSAEKVSALKKVVDKSSVDNDVISDKGSADKESAV